MEALILVLKIVENLILLILIGLSVWSIGIMIDRHRNFKSIEETDGNLNEAKDLIRHQRWAELEDWVTHRKGPRAGTLATVMETYKNGDSQVDRSVKSYLTDEKMRIEKGFTVLATLGSNAPFIGLFGTVLGIIQAFNALNDSSAGGANKVMAGIALALVATAAGLFVAIPAVVSFNVFSQKSRRILTECSSIKDFYLSRVKSDSHSNRETA